MTQHEQQFSFQQNLLCCNSDEELCKSLLESEKLDFKEVTKKEWIPTLNYLEALIGNFTSHHSSIYKISKFSFSQKPELKEKKKNPTFIVKSTTILKILDFIVRQLKHLRADKLENSLLERIAELLNSEDPNIISKALDVWVSRKEFKGIVKRPYDYRLLTLAFGYGENSLNQMIVKVLPQYVLDNADKFQVSLYNDAKQGQLGDCSQDVTTIHMDNLLQDSRPAIEIYRSLVKGKNISRMNQFSLWTIIRLSKSVHSQEERLMWTTIRLKSFVALVSFGDQSNIHISNLFHHQPNFLKELKEYISNDEIDYESRTPAIRLLSRLLIFPSYRVVMQPILFAPSSGTELLMDILRKIQDAMESGNNQMNEENGFVEEVFNLFSVIVTPSLEPKKIQLNGYQTELLKLTISGIKQRNWFIACNSVNILMLLHTEGFVTQQPSSVLEIYTELIHNHIEIIEHTSSQEHNQQMLKDCITNFQYNTLLYSLEFFNHFLIRLQGVNARSVFESLYLNDVKLVLQKQKHYGSVIVGEIVEPLVYLMNAEPALIPLLEKSSLLHQLISQLKEPDTEIDRCSSLLVAFALNKNFLEIIRNSNVLPTVVQRIHTSNNYRSIGAMLNVFARHHPSLQDQIFEAVFNTLEALTNECNPEKVFHISLSRKKNQEGDECLQLKNKIVGSLTIISRFLNRHSTLTKVFIQKSGLQYLRKLLLKCSSNIELLRKITSLIDGLKMGLTSMDTIQFLCKFIEEDFLELDTNHETLFHNAEQSGKILLFLGLCVLVSSSRNLFSNKTNEERLEICTLLSNTLPFIFRHLPKLNSMHSHLSIMHKNLDSKSLAENNHFPIYSRSIFKFFDSLQPLIFHHATGILKEEGNIDPFLQLSDTIANSMKQVLEEELSCTDPPEVLSLNAYTVSQYLYNLLIFSSPFSGTDAWRTNIIILHSFSNGALKIFAQYFEFVSKKVLDLWNDLPDFVKEKLHEYFFTSCTIIERIIRRKTYLPIFVNCLEVKLNFKPILFAESICNMFANAFTMLMHHPNLPKLRGRETRIIINVVAQMEKCKEEIHDDALSDFEALGFPKDRILKALSLFSNKEDAGEWLINNRTEEEVDPTAKHSSSLEQLRNEATDWCLNLAKSTSEDISVACSGLLDVFSKKPKTSNLSESIHEALISTDELKKSMQVIINVIAPLATKNELKREHFEFESKCLFTLVLNKLQEISNSPDQQGTESVLKLIHILAKNGYPNDSLFNPQEAISIINSIKSILQTPGFTKGNCLTLSFQILQALTIHSKFATEALSLDTDMILISLPQVLSGIKDVVIIESILRQLIEHDRSMTKHRICIKLHSMFQDRSGRVGIKASTLISSIMSEFHYALEELFEVMVEKVVLKGAYIELKNPESECILPNPDTLDRTLKRLTSYIFSYREQGEKDQGSENQNSGLLIADALYILIGLLKTYNCGSLILNIENPDDSKCSFIDFLLQEYVSQLIQYKVHSKGERSTKQKAARLSVYLLKGLANSNPSEIVEKLIMYLNDNSQSYKVIFGISFLLRSFVADENATLLLLQKDVFHSLMNIIDKFDLNHPDAMELSSELTSTIFSILGESNGFITEEALIKKIDKLHIPYLSYEKEYSRERDMAVRVFTFSNEYPNYFSRDEADYEGEYLDEEISESEHHDEHNENEENENMEDDDEVESEVDDEGDVEVDDDVDEEADEDEDEEDDEDEDEVDVFENGTEDNTNPMWFVNDGQEGGPILQDIRRRVIERYRELSHLPEYREPYEGFISPSRSSSALMIGSEREQGRGTVTSTSVQDFIRRIENTLETRSPTTPTTSSSLRLSFLENNENGGVISWNGSNIRNRSPHANFDASLFHDISFFGEDNQNEDDDHINIEEVGIDDELEISESDEDESTNEEIEENVTNISHSEEITDNVSHSEEITNNISHSEENAEETEVIERPPHEEEFPIDPTFLAALPSDLRAEILSSHIAELVNPNSEVYENESTISQAFLSALSDEIREEVLSLERRYLQDQQEQRPAQNEISTNEAPSENTNDTVNETLAFISSLSPHLREEVLLTMEPQVLETLPQEIQDEARSLQARYLIRLNNSDSHRGERRVDILKEVRGFLSSFVGKFETGKGEPFVTKRHITSIFRLLYLSKNKSKSTILKILHRLSSVRMFAEMIIDVIMKIFQQTKREDYPIFYEIYGEPMIMSYSICCKTLDYVPDIVIQRIVDIIMQLGETSFIKLFVEEHTDEETQKTAFETVLAFLGNGFTKLRTSVRQCILNFISDTVFHYSKSLNTLRDFDKKLDKEIKSREKENLGVKERKMITKCTSTKEDIDDHIQNILESTSKFITEQSINLILDIFTTNGCSNLEANFAMQIINNFCRLKPAIRSGILEKLSILTRADSRIIAKSLRDRVYNREQNEMELRFCRSITTYSNIVSDIAKESTGSEHAKSIQGLSDYQFDHLWEALQYFMKNSDTRPSSSAFSRLLPLIEAFFSFQSLFLHEENEEDDEQLIKTMDLQTPTSATPSGRLEKFLEDNRDVLNNIVRNNLGLLEGNLSLFISKFPKFVDFDNKRAWFKKALEKDQKRSGANIGVLRMNVRREHIFVDAFFNLRSKRPEELKQKLNVHFQGEEGADAGGLTRDFFLVLSREMFNPNYALFTQTADRLFQPNPYSYVNSEHLEYFQFVARVIAMAIYSNQLLDCYFTRSFYKHILGKKITYQDIESVDPELYKNLKWMLENDITDILELTFAARVDEFGKHKIIELKPNGENVPVTNENKHEYVKLRTELTMTTQIKKQLESFLSAFYEVIPRRLIRIFNPEELELLISGLPDFNVEDLRRNTDYVGYDPNDEVIEWFWKWVSELNQNDKALFLQFVTGTSKVPLDGFANLVGMSGIQKFNIHRVDNPNLLPTSHTCFNQLDLSAYESEEQLRKNLYIAIREGSSGFGFV